LEAALQPLEPQFQRVWLLHRWHIASRRRELSTSGLDMGFLVFQIRM
jgi:hypothetical protein